MTRRLVHLPRGHSYKIKGPSILVNSSVTKTITQLLPQSISDILISVALKRKLSYQSDYIYEHINSANVIKLFKLLKFTFQNIHYKDVVFSKKMLDYDVKSFVQECKESLNNINHDEDIGKSDSESFPSSEEEDEINIKEKIDKLSFKM